MRDVELYRAILGLTAPWMVASVDLDVKGQQVVVHVAAGPGPFPCPECGTPAACYDSKPRRWRHLDTCQFMTWIQADVPRVDCTAHGVKQIRIPWAEPGSQFTGLFERLAIDLLRECSVTGAARLLRITWDEAWGIKGRAVKRGLADLDQGRVLYLADDRKQESLDGFWATLTEAQQAGIQAVAMDMWEPYVQSTQTHLPDAAAKIVFDKFHVVKHLHDAVDKVRRTEHRALKRAWALKERFRTFWEYRYAGAARKFFTRWYWRATHSRLAPMVEVGKLIRRHLPNLLTYLRHRVTNAGLEAVNAAIQWVKKTARGFRNPEHFKIAIYFHCGGLDLYPHGSR